MTFHHHHHNSATAPARTAGRIWRGPQMQNHRPQGDWCGAFHQWGYPQNGWFIMVPLFRKPPFNHQRYGGTPGKLGREWEYVIGIFNQPLHPFTPSPCAKKTETTVQWWDLHIFGNTPCWIQRDFGVALNHWTIQCWGKQFWAMQCHAHKTWALQNFNAGKCWEYDLLSMICMFCDFNFQSASTHSPMKKQHFTQQLPSPSFSSAQRAGSRAQSLLAAGPVVGWSPEVLSDKKKRWKYNVRIHKYIPIISIRYPWCFKMSPIDPCSEQSFQTLKFGWSQPSQLRDLSSSRWPRSAVFLEIETILGLDRAGDIWCPTHWPRAADGRSAPPIPSSKKVPVKSWDNNPWCGKGKPII